MLHLRTPASSTNILGTFSSRSLTEKRSIWPKSIQGKNWATQCSAFSRRKNKSSTTKEKYSINTLFSPSLLPSSFFLILKPWKSSQEASHTSLQKRHWISQYSRTEHQKLYPVALFSFPTDPNTIY